MGVDEPCNLVELVYLRSDNLRKHLYFFFVCKHACEILLTLQELFVYTARIRGPFDVLL